MFKWGLNRVLKGYFSRFLEDSATRFIAEQGRVQAEVEAFMQNMPMGEFGRVAQANLESWQKLQQEMLAVEQPETMPDAASFQAWGEKRGGRLVADVLIYANQRVP